MVISGASLEVEVALAAMAVVADVQRGGPGQAADGAAGLVVVHHADPQGGSAVAGVPVVEIDRLLVVGEGCDDAAGQARLAM